MLQEAKPVLEELNATSSSSEMVNVPSPINARLADNNNNNDAVPLAATPAAQLNKLVPDQVALGAPAKPTVIGNNKDIQTRVRFPRFPITPYSVNRPSSLCRV